MASISALLPHRSDDLSRRLFWPALMMFSVCKIWLTLGRYLNQDEFETLHQGWLIFQGAVPYRDFRSNHPPLAFKALGALNYLTQDAVAIIYMARALTLLASALVLTLVYRIAHDLFGTTAARWAVIVYAVNVTFWEGSTEIRTDFVMVPLWLFGVSCLLTRRPCATTVRMVLIGLAMGTAFWVNQKVVLHAVPMALLMLMGGPDRDWRFRDVATALAASLVPAVYVLGVASSNGSVGDLVQHNFLGGCAWGMVKDQYYTAWRTVTLSRAVQFDAGFVLLALIACVWAIGEHRTRSQVFVSLSAVWMLFTLFLTPSPFAYYLLSVFPLFAIVIGGFLAERFASPPTAPESDGSPIRRWGIAVAIVLFTLFPLARMEKFVQPTIRDQLTVIRTASELLSPATRVFDGAGALVNRPDAYPFHWVLWQPEIAAYRAGLLPPVLPTLRQNGCRAVIDTYRVQSLNEADRQQLKTHFVRLWGPIRVPGYDSIEPIGTMPIEIDLWYDGVYQSSHPELIVDGRPMKLPRHLSSGRHVIQFPEGGERVILREACTHPEMPLPADDYDPRDFLGKYGYGY